MDLLNSDRIIVRKAMDLGEVVPGAMCATRRRRSRYNSMEVRCDIVDDCEVIVDKFVELLAV